MRLACGPCYDALLDLAVCWVCGEVVFRGDECVSLGWCFWHRACYGCLLCGDRRVVEGVSVGELFDYDDGGGGGEAGMGMGIGMDMNMGRGRGREVDEVPLCGKCADEMGEGKADDEHLVPMALERIDWFDGGLSRRRWEAGMGRLPQGQRLPVSEGDDDTQGAQPGNYQDGMAGETIKTFGGQTQGEPSLQDRKFELGSETGTAPSRPSQRDEPCKRRASSPIYVSMRDPVGGPAFRPSKTKPIPKWMRYLPGQEQVARDYANRPSSILDDYFSPPSSSVTTESDTESKARDSMLFPPQPPLVPPHTLPLRPTVPTTHECLPTPPKAPNTWTQSSSTASRSGSNLNPTTTSARRDPTAFSPFQMSRPFTLITEEPVQRPSTKLGAGRLPPSRHVHFLSPSQASSTASVRRYGRPSESSEFLERCSGRHDHDCDHVGGDGVDEPADVRRPVLVMFSWEQFMRALGLS